MTDFPVCTWLSLLMVNLSVWYLPNQQEEHNHHEPQPALWPTLRQPRHVWFFCTMFFHVLSHIGMYAFFSLYLDSLGYSKFMIGLFWAVSVVVEIIGFYTQSRWMHHLSLSGWVLFCSSIMVLRMYITAWWADYLIGLVLAQMLHAITFAIHHTVCIAWINTYFPPRLRGRGQALYSVIGYGLTGVLGTLAGAALSEHFGLQSIYIGSMCAALAAALAASGLLIKGRADEKQ